MNPLVRAWQAAHGALSIKRVRSHLDVACASLSLDAPPARVLAVVGPLLERRRVRATLHLAAEDLAAADAGALAALRDAGHELGLRASPRGEDVGLELAGAAAQLLDRTGVRAASLAWSDGPLPRSAKRVGARAFAVARGGRSGVNAGLVDLADLRAVPLAAAPDLASAVARARADRGWLVLRSDLSGPPGEVEAALDLLAGEGLELLPLKHAAARVLFGD